MAADESMGEWIRTVLEERYESIKNLG